MLDFHSISCTAKKTCTTAENKRQMYGSESTKTVINTGLSVYYSECFWPTALNRGCDMLFLVMGFNLFN